MYLNEASYLIKYMRALLRYKWGDIFFVENHKSSSVAYNKFTLLVIFNSVAYTRYSSHCWLYLIVLLIVHIVGYI